MVNMKLFSTKKDAIDYKNKCNNNNLRLFQEDINSNGSKRFLIGTIRELYNSSKKKIIKLL